MVKPVNGHLLIEPIPQENFIASQNDKYEEIGVVIAVPEPHPSGLDKTLGVSVGDKVYFDSWMAAKFPKKDVNGEYYWLVKWEDVRAVERND